jgi:uncharacterized protein (TIGR02284 family)
MSPAHTRATKIIYDLVQVHRERIEDYRQTHFSEEPDLKAIFGDIIRQSTLYQQELTDCISRSDADPANPKNKRKGNVYNTWMKTKAAISGDNHKSILESCKAELEAVQYAYIAALSIADSIQSVIRRLIETQFYGIKSILDSIEQYHDAL